MIFSRLSSEKKMHQAIKVSVSLALAAALATSLLAAPKNEYFTEDELDLIRDAQELGQRVPVYLLIAERRLVFLGIMEKSAQAIELEHKEHEKRAKEAREAKKNTIDSRANADRADDSSSLGDFTPAELFGGYIQALDETMTNIDDAYGQKLDVRDSIEDLAKFTRVTIPLLEKYKPKNASDRTAVEKAIDKAKQAAADAKVALSIVPKTEKKRKP
jgi:hypothetical protein